MMQGRVLDDAGQCALMMKGRALDVEGCVWVNVSMCAGGRLRECAEGRSHCARCQLAQYRRPAASAQGIGCLSTGGRLLPCMWRVPPCRRLWASAQEVVSLKDGIQVRKGPPTES